MVWALDSMGNISKLPISYESVFGKGWEGYCRSKDIIKTNILNKYFDSISYTLTLKELLWGKYIPPKNDLAEPSNDF